MAGAAKRALVILAEGAEEIEVVVAVDVLRRGGVDVTLAGLTGNEPVKCSRNVVIIPDTSLDDALTKAPYDAVVLPGGLGGGKVLAASAKVGEVLRAQEKEGRLVATICAGSTTFISHGIASGKSVTSHYFVKDQFSGTGINYLDQRVVQDGNFITSQGIGTAIEFALKVVEYLQGKEKVEEIKKPMILPN